MFEGLQFEEESHEDVTVMHAAQYCPTLTSCNRVSISHHRELQPESTCLVQMDSPQLMQNKTFIFDSLPTDYLLAEDSSDCPVATAATNDPISIATLSRLRPRLYLQHKEGEARYDPELAAYYSGTSKRTQASTNYFSGASHR